MNWLLLGLMLLIIIIIMTIIIFKTYHGGVEQFTEKAFEEIIKCGQSAIDKKNEAVLKNVDICKAHVETNMRYFAEQRNEKCYEELKIVYGILISIQKDIEIQIERVKLLFTECKQLELYNSQDPLIKSIIDITNSNIKGTQFGNFYSNILPIIVTHDFDDVKLTKKIQQIIQDLHDINSKIRLPINALIHIKEVFDDKLKKLKKLNMYEQEKDIVNDETIKKSRMDNRVEKVYKFVSTFPEKIYNYYASHNACDLELLFDEYREVNIQTLALGNKVLKDMDIDISFYSDFIDEAEKYFNIIKSSLHELIIILIPLRAADPLISDIIDKLATLEEDFDDSFEVIYNSFNWLTGPDRIHILFERQIQIDKDAILSHCIKIEESSEGLIDLCATYLRYYTDFNDGTMLEKFKSHRKA
jgi:hypothetical protein